MNALPRSRRFVLTLVFLAAAAAPSRADGVWVIQGQGAGSHATIQEAVDAAGDGGILILGGGTYAPFVIDGKSLVVYAATGQTANITGTVEIRNLPASGYVLLARISARGAVAPTISGSGLKLTNDLGHVRLVDCTFTGGRGQGHPLYYCDDPLGDGGHGAEVTGSLRVAFTNCTLTGGYGGAENQDYECVGGRGGDGVRATNSVVYLQQGRCIGGHGGDAGEYAAVGGTGLRTTGNGIFASGVQFQGGNGGDAWDWAVYFPGRGGDGVFVDANTGAHMLASPAAGGQGGHSLDGDAPLGNPRTGAGIYVDHGGVARSAVVPRIVPGGTPALVTFHGTVGDQFVQQGSASFDFHLLPASNGFQLILPPTTNLTPPATVTLPTGDVTASMPVATVPPGNVGTLMRTQAVAVDGSSTTFLASPGDLVVLDRAAHPDCNGNGVLDYFDIQEGTSDDCDGNLVPDECDPDCNGNLVPDGCDLDSGSSADCNGNRIPDECDIASGLEADCNGNRIPDACDIAAGRSQDLDHDGVLDECESPGTWYVFPLSPNGGDGSSNFPFRTIRQAVDASQTGDTVILLDGTYSTADDRGIAFGQRQLFVRSRNGPEHCVVDCQGANKAFTLSTGSFGACTIEGITIRNGSSVDGGGAIHDDSCPLTLRNCVFQDCTDLQAGGAVSITGARAVLEDCVFDGNSASLNAPLGTGGALLLASSEGSIVRRCRFLENAAANGGAVTTVYSTTNLFSHCVFRSNSSVFDGGATFTHTTSVFNAPGVVYDNCTFDQNVAGGKGGAIYNSLYDAGSTDYHLTVSSSTFVGNTATRGGAICCTVGFPFTVVDSILWGNSASIGPQIALTTGTSQPPHLVVSYCDVQGGTSGIDVGPGSLTYGAGNIDADPLFQTGALSLSPESPCIDAGSNTLASKDLADVDGDGNTNEPVPLDLSLHGRFLDVSTRPDTGVGPGPVIDIGAYEARVPRLIGRWRSHP